MAKREELGQSRFRYTVTPREDLTGITGEETEPDTVALLTGIMAYRLDLDPNDIKLLKIRKATRKEEAS